MPNKDQHVALTCVTTCLLQQVCSLATALEAQGVPSDVVDCLLTAGLALDLSLYVAGG
jgi:hypothetical protein